MLFRLTYAMSYDEIYTVELRSINTTDITDCYEEAMRYLVNEIGATKVLDIIGLSILILPQVEHASN